MLKVTKTQPCEMLLYMYSIVAPVKLVSAAVPTEEVNGQNSVLPFERILPVNNVFPDAEETFPCMHKSVMIDGGSHGDITPRVLS